MFMTPAGRNVFVRFEAVRLHVENGCWYCGADQDEGFWGSDKTVSQAEAGRTGVFAPSDFRISFSTDCLRLVPASCSGCTGR